MGEKITGLSSNIHTSFEQKAGTLTVKAAVGSDYELVTEGSELHLKEKNSNYSDVKDHYVGRSTPKKIVLVGTDKANSIKLKIREQGLPKGFQEIQILTGDEDDTVIIEGDSHDNQPISIKITVNSGGGGDQINVKNVAELDLSKSLTAGENFVFETLGTSRVDLVLSETAPAVTRRIYATNIQRLLFKQDDFTQSKKLHSLGINMNMPDPQQADLLRQIANRFYNNSSVILDVTGQDRTDYHIVGIDKFQAVLPRDSTNRLNIAAMNDSKIKYYGPLNHGGKSCTELGLLDFDPHTIKQITLDRPDDSKEAEALPVLKIDNETMTISGDQGSDFVINGNNDGSFEIEEIALVKPMAN